MENLEQILQAISLLHIEDKPIEDYRLTQECILKLSRYSPQMNYAVSLWARKEVTWEQATYMMIIALLESKTALEEKMVKMITNQSSICVTFNKDIDAINNVFTEV